jgi:NAD(P)-dependent dehydrogenase (short-subunit alcohol dehydrogenase family)
MKFQDQVVCITGGVFELAQAFVDEGARVVIVGDETGRVAAEQAGAAFEPMDVRDAKSVKRAVQAIAGRFGRIDVWINNSRIPRITPAVDLTPQDWDVNLGALLSGVFYYANAVGRIMIEQKRGSFINIASVHGLLAQKGHAAYASANAGLIMLTKVLASEWGEYGVRVNAVAPGIISDQVPSGPISEEPYLGRIPMGRMGEGREVIEAVLFLANEAEASFVNGEILRVDGGWTAYHLFHPFEKAF